MKNIKTDVSEVLCFSLIHNLLLHPTDIEGYKKGYLGIDGKILKEPKTPKEQELTNPYSRVILKLKYMMRGREQELKDMLTLKQIPESVADNVANSLYRGAINKNALNLFSILLENMDR